MNTSSNSLSAGNAYKLSSQILPDLIDITLIPQVI